MAKRRLARGPQAPEEQPRKKRGREGRSKKKSDIYEAEDSDPDEVKHADRFDVSGCSSSRRRACRSLQAALMELLPARCLMGHC